MCTDITDDNMMIHVMMHQVNKEAKHFYDCWDLMTLSVIVGLLSLLEETGCLVSI